MPTQITAYKTSDDTIYETEEMAKLHEKKKLLLEYFNRNPILGQEEGSVGLVEILDWLKDPQNCDAMAKAIAVAQNEGGES